MWESIIRGFGWTLGRHAATDMYRRPGMFVQLLATLFGALWLLIKWAFGLTIIFAAIVILINLWFGVSR